MSDLSEDMEKMMKRIREIDRDFEAATGWGSWMVMCANEREDLVNKLKAMGLTVPHKYQARDENGNRVD